MWQIILIPLLTLGKWVNWWLWTWLYCRWRGNLTICWTIKIGHRCGRYWNWASMGPCTRIHAALVGWSTWIRMSHLDKRGEWDWMKPNELLILVPEWWYKPTESLQLTWSWSKVTWSWQWPTKTLKRYPKKSENRVQLQIHHKQNCGIRYKILHWNLSWWWISGTVATQLKDLNRIVSYLSLSNFFPTIACQILLQHWRIFH